MRGGSGGSPSVTATYNAAMPSATMPTRPGYTFGGYYTGADGAGTQYYTASGASARSWTTDSGGTLYAKWTARTYPVTLERAGGSGGTSSVTAKYDAAMPKITPPTRTGYTFGGYYRNSVKYYNADGTSARAYDLPGGATLTAQWTARTYKVKIDFGASVTFRGATWQAYTYPVADKLLVTGTNGAVNLHTPSRTGYTFGGYYDAAQGASGDQPSGSLVYDSEGKAVAGSYWTASYANNGLFKGLASVSLDTFTVYARWTLNTYTITLDRDGGTGGTGSVSVAYGAKPQPISVPTRTGYSFGGYYTGRNGTGTRIYSAIGYAYDIAWGAGDATLYAYWRRNVTLTVTASCTDNDGAIPAASGTPTVKIGNTSGSGFVSATVIEGQTVTVSAGGATGITLAYFGSSAWDRTMTPSADGTVEFVVPAASNGMSVVAYYDRNVVQASVSLGSGSSDVAAQVQILPAETPRRFGDEVTFSAQTGTGLTFYGWSDDRDSPRAPVSENASYAVTLTGDTALYAHYARNVSVTAGTGGSVNVSVFGEDVQAPSEGFKVPLGSAFRVVSSADDGYFFTKITFTEDGGGAVDTQYGADAEIRPQKDGEYAVAFAEVPPDKYLACVDVAESGATGAVGTTTAAYDGGESGVFEPVDAADVDDDLKQNIPSDWSVTWFKARQGLSVRLSARRASASGALEWKATDVFNLPLPGNLSLMGATPQEASEQGDESWTDRDFAVSGNVLVRTKWGVFDSPKVTLVPTRGGRAVFKGVDPVGGQDVHEKEFPPVQGVYQTTTIKAIPDPSGGYAFSGWYRGENLVWTEEEYAFEVRADVTLEARFRLDDNAVFAWEGGRTNKVMEWKSGVVTMPRPGDPVAVRVDATGYPVDTGVFTYSSPNAEDGRSHDVVVAQQDARRLPRMRPERFWQVSVRADVEIDAVVVATNIVEAN